jgi:hypothetical protein
LGLILIFTSLVLGGQNWDGVSPSKTKYVQMMGPGKIIGIMFVQAIHNVTSLVLGGDKIGIIHNVTSLVLGGDKIGIRFV